MCPSGKESAIVIKNMLHQQTGEKAVRISLQVSSAD